MTSLIKTFLSPRPPNEKFVNWCRQPVEHQNADAKISASDLARTSPNWWNELKNAIVDGTSYTQPINVTIDLDLKQSSEISFQGLSFNKYIGLFEIKKSVKKTLTIASAYIRKLEVSSYPGVVRLVIKDSFIRELKVDAENAQVYLTLENSQIGIFAALRAKQISSLDVSGGSILNFNVPSTQENSPFTGNVSFYKVFLPRNINKYLLSNAQPYRNMRHHLIGLENSQMANLFHSAELAVERVRDKKLDKFLSWLYEKLSDYGSSTLKPIVWFCVLISTFTVFVYIYDGTAMPALDEEQPIGWLKDISADDCYGDVSRAIAYTVQSTVNPLGIFSTKTVLIPKDIWVAIGTLFYSLCSLILITLFILAVRRRFKIQA